MEKQQSFGLENNKDTTFSVEIEGMMDLSLLPGDASEDDGVGLRGDALGEGLRLGGVEEVDLLGALGGGEGGVGQGGDGGVSGRVVEGKDRVGGAVEAPCPAVGGALEVGGDDAPSAAPNTTGEGSARFEMMVDRRLHHCRRPLRRRHRRRRRLRSNDRRRRSRLVRRHLSYVTRGSIYFFIYFYCGPRMPMFSEWAHTKNNKITINN